MTEPPVITCGPLYQLARESNDEWRLYQDESYHVLHYSLAPEERVVKTALAYVEQKHGLKPE